jgi:5-methylcytosine-specific restriction endonuclease McrA
MTGNRPPSRDHIRPRSKGFTLADPANRAIVCQPCNTDKGSRSLASFLFRLRRAVDPRAVFVAAFLEYGFKQTQERHRPI